MSSTCTLNNKLWHLSNRSIKTWFRFSKGTSISRDHPHQLLMLLISKKSFQEVKSWASEAYFVHDKGSTFQITFYSTCSWSPEDKSLHILLQSYLFVYQHQYQVMGIKIKCVRIMGRLPCLRSVEHICASQNTKPFEDQHCSSRDI